MTKLRSVAQVRRLIRSFECGKRHCVGSQASSCRGPWRYADEDDRCCQSVREMSWYVAEKLKLNQIFSGPWNCMGIWGRGDKRNGLGNGFDVELLAQLISPALEALVISFSLLHLVYSARGVWLVPDERLIAIDVPIRYWKNRVDHCNNSETAAL